MSVIIKYSVYLDLKDNKHQNQTLAHISFPQKERT